MREGSTFERILWTKSLAMFSPLFRAFAGPRFENNGKWFMNPKLVHFIRSPCSSFFVRGNPRVQSRNPPIDLNTYWGSSSWNIGPCFTLVHICQKHSCLRWWFHHHELTSITVWLRLGPLSGGLDEPPLPELHFTYYIRSRSDTGPKSMRHEVKEEIKFTAGRLIPIDGLPGMDWPLKFCS